MYDCLFKKPPPPAIGGAALNYALLEYNASLGNL